jgi:glutathione S-transferase
MVLTLFFLENSRAFRVLWLANELKVPLQVRNYPRIEGKKAVSSMSPLLQDMRL